MNYHHPCSVTYVGEGVLRLYRTDPGRTADFARLRLSGDGRVRTEYVPGFAGLSFTPEALTRIAKLQPCDQVELRHPEWTCDDYEAHLRQLAADDRQG